ncbi:hypothetical protein QMA79_18305 [Pseudomonas aeruginosa]|uniref:hypothetical protein n=1 Tax=Pseudomonas aeruginosa TaxID=287 RepID=UPI0024AE467C|nr:hypothetical protein [Pseudomonas aeruginosa]MDI6671766.1 hypothetical protein [Pseudomonas aeruginosa]
MQNATNIFAFEQRYNEKLEELAGELDEVPPSYRELMAQVSGLLGEDGHPLDVISGYDDFEAFFTWLDTLTAYDQMDEDGSLEDHKPLLEVVYEAIRAGVV